MIKLKDITDIVNRFEGDVMGQYYFFVMSKYFSELPVWRQSEFVHAVQSLKTQFQTIANEMRCLVNSTSFLNDDIIETAVCKISIPYKNGRDLAILADKYMHNFISATLTQENIKRSHNDLDDIFDDCIDELLVDFRKPTMSPVSLLRAKVGH